MNIFNVFRVALALAIGLCIPGCASTGEHHASSSSCSRGSCVTNSNSACATVQVRAAD